MKINILKISAICASLFVASSVNAQIVGFEVTDISGNPTSDITLIENTSQQVYGVRVRSPYGKSLTSMSGKINVTNAGGRAYGISSDGTSQVTISNDIYVESGTTDVFVLEHFDRITLQGDITLTAYAPNGNSNVISSGLTYLYGSGGTHTMIGDIQAGTALHFFSGNYIWDHYTKDSIMFVSANIARIESGVRIEFMKAVSIHSSSLTLRGQLSFHTSDTSGFLLRTPILDITSTARFTVILDDGFEAFENDQMSIWSGSSIATGGFDASNVSIVLSSTGENLTYGDDFIVSSTGVVTFLTDIGVVIPEPSTYAAIFGLLALGLAIYRRRK